MIDLLHALPGLLQAYPQTLRDEADRLAEDGAVITLDVIGPRLDAEVKLDNELVHVVWEFEHGRWEADTDSENPEIQDLAKCLALVSVQRNDGAGFTPDEPPAPPARLLTFTQIIEENLGRKLVAEEQGYVSKVEKRFERVAKTGEIFDQDIVRLHPKWSIQSYDALALWPEKPATSHEFWNYIALALYERGLPFPGFLKPATDLKGTREKLRAWRASRSVPHWVERIQRLIAYKPVPPKPRALEACRLLITTSEAKLQVREAGSDGFASVAPSEMAGLRADHARGGFQALGAGSELLLSSCFLQMQATGEDTFRFDNDQQCTWLATMFGKHSLSDKLVTLDEAPFQRSAEPLRWVAEESSEGASIALRLVLPDGSPLPLPMRVLAQETTPLYLSGDTLYPGPQWFGEETSVEPQIEIPFAALTSSEGIAFIEQLGAPLPPSLASRIRREKLEVEIVAKCAVASGGSSQHAHFVVSAATPDGRHRETLRGGRWMPELSATAEREEGTIIVLDRSGLHSVPDLLEGMKATFDNDLDVFRSRMTRTFPETFYAWATQLPAAVKFSPDEGLNSILADPLIARVRIEATQSASIDWFDLRVVFDIEGCDLKPAEIRRLLAAKGGFVKLADGTWRRVKIELSEDQQEMVEAMGIDLNDLEENEHRVHWRNLVGQRGAEIMNAELWLQLQDRMSAIELAMKPDVPKGLAYTLRPYQVEGYHFLSYLTANRFGGILADDMGLGKTVQTISWILWLRNEWRGTGILPATSGTGILPVTGAEGFQPDSSSQLLLAQSGTGILPVTSAEGFQPDSPAPLPAKKAARKASKKKAAAVAVAEPVVVSEAAPTTLVTTTAAAPATHIPPTIVVCPKSVLDVWALEFLKAAPDLRVQVLHDKDELEVERLHGDLDVLVINYAQLRSCAEPLSTITFLAAILDEGQHIKNPDSKAARAACEIKAHNRLVLTGTPLENKLLDLWSLMSFATPGALGDRSYFHKHFDRRKDERAAQRLSARLRPFILRRTKGQVARDLPPRTEEALICEMSDIQQQMYQDELAKVQNMVIAAAGTDALAKRRFAILQALTRLRQICCHPGLVQKDEVGLAAESAKLTAALELIEELHEAGHKVLFFSQFVSMLKIVRDKLESMNLPFHWLTGASDNRADIVKKFQEDEQASVFLISLKAGGSGLNLTAASYVILYDPWWNPAVENQAIDRAHRIGQTQPVIAYRILTKNTIEEKILALQQQKNMLSGDILGESSFAQNLQAEDFEFLLGIERDSARKARRGDDEDE